MRKFTARLLETLLPERCPRCCGSTGSGYCAGCRDEFPRVATPCPRCGLPEPVAHCPRARAPWHVRAVVAPLLYASPVAEQIHALKFRGARRLGRALGLVLANAAPAPADIDALVPVPLAPARMRDRGYNQAHEIARAVAGELRLPVAAAALRRLRADPPQSTLGARERRANLRGAFAAARGVEGLRLALVDDVVTTGATVNACARCLLEGGAAAVEAWAVARAVE